MEREFFPHSYMASLIGSSSSQRPQELFIDQSHLQEASHNIAAGFIQEDERDMPSRYKDGDRDGGVTKLEIESLRYSLWHHHQMSATGNCMKLWLPEGRSQSLPIKYCQPWCSFPFIGSTYELIQLTINQHPNKSFALRVALLEWCPDGVSHLFRSSQRVIT